MKKLLKLLKEYLRAFKEGFDKGYRTDEKWRP